MGLDKVQGRPGNPMGQVITAMAGMIDNQLGWGDEGLASAFYIAEKIGVEGDAAYEIIESALREALRIPGGTGRESQ